jgi:hypothetical protein
MMRSIDAPAESYALLAAIHTEIRELDESVYLNLSNTSFWAWADECIEASRNSACPEKWHALAIRIMLVPGAINSIEERARYMGVHLELLRAAEIAERSARDARLALKSYAKHPRFEGIRPALERMVVAAEAACLAASGALTEAYETIGAYPNTRM